MVNIISNREADGKHDENYFLYLFNSGYVKVTEY